MIIIKRIYTAKSESDGVRVLVDRIWPRGINKDEANLDEWMKDIAPSKELRKWFSHDPEKFREFKSNYIAELETKPEKVTRLLNYAANDKLVLLYGAKDEEHNQAVVLKEFLENELKGH